MNKPFLKWAGGKQKIYHHIISLLPAGQRLLEPFVGSGAIFLNTNYADYLLSDINEDLINLYLMLQQQGEKFICYAKKYFIPANNNKARFYELRDFFNNCHDPLERAAMFVYFNRHSYNGLCRYNSTGKFNVPFGHYKQPIYPETAMRFFHQRSQGIKFKCQDFIQIMSKAKPGDIIYCDPPYVPLTKTAQFTSYSKQPFGLEKQIKLAELAYELAAKGIPVLLSNHDTPFTRRVYYGAKLKKLKVVRYISCKANKRQPARELLALFN